LRNHIGYAHTRVLARWFSKTLVYPIVLCYDEIRVYTNDFHNSFMIFFFFLRLALESYQFLCVWFYVSCTVRACVCVGTINARRIVKYSESHQNSQRYKFLMSERIDSTRVYVLWNVYTRHKIFMSKNVRQKNAKQSKKAPIEPVQR